MKRPDKVYLDNEEYIRKTSVLKMMKEIIDEETAYIIPENTLYYQGLAVALEKLDRMIKEL